MRAADLRRLVREPELEELGKRLRSDGRLPGVFFRLARGFAPYVAAFRLEPEATERLSRAASDVALAILAHEARRPDDRDVALADAASGDWRACAAARERLEREGAWLDPRVVGSLAPSAPPPPDAAHPRWLDASIACEALIVAAREMRNARAIEAYREAAEFARHGDAGAEPRARMALRRLLPAFAANAADAGMNRREARAAALIAAERLAGLAAPAGRSAFRLSAAALGTLPIGARRALSGAATKPSWDARRGPTAGREASSHDRLVASLRELNDWRARTLDAARKDAAVRRFGAAALGACYGFAHGWQRAKALSAAAHRPHVAADAAGNILIDALRPVRLAPDRLARLAGLALDAAASRLALLADDRRETPADRRRYAALRDALARGLHGRDASRISFAAWSGLPEEPHATAPIDDGGRLWWAAPRGRFPAVREARGARGRAIACRALSDAYGRLVGYAGFDALSREFHGEPLYALYDLAGRRVGRLEPAEGGGHAALGDARLPFMTAPEALSLAAA